MSEFDDAMAAEASEALADRVWRPFGRSVRGVCVFASGGVICGRQTANEGEVFVAVNATSIEAVVSRDRFLQAVRCQVLAPIPSGAIVASFAPVPWNRERRSLC